MTGERKVLGIVSVKVDLKAYVYGFSEGKSLADGSSNLEGSVEGIKGVTGEGKMEGSNVGSNDGTIDGRMEGIVEGSWVGFN